MGINKELLRLASWRTENSLEKQAVVPPGGGAPPMDPMAGGAPPMDPMMGGGAPPMDPMAGGAPPMDPMAGGAPPMDPMAGGGDIRAIIQEELANAGMGGNGAAAGPAGAKAKKFDPAELDVKLYNMEKLIVAISNALGVSLPPEALLGPPPEGSEAPEGAAGADAPAAPAGPESAIKPIEPIQPAMPTGPEGGGAPPMGGGGNLKISAHTESVPTVGSPIAVQTTVTAADLLSKTAAMAQMARSLNQRG